MQGIIDDKSQHCIPFLLERLELHHAQHATDNVQPFFIGLNGLQGAGKTVLVSTLCSLLSAPPYNLPTLAFSIDNLYLTHADQKRLAAAHPNNPLLQHRGQPSTHDVELCKRVFDCLKRGLPLKIPSYDKSAFNGQGDRESSDKWEVVNDHRTGKEPVKVVIFEGWCVGFRARPVAEIRAAWEDAVRMKEAGNYTGQLGNVKLEDVLTINEALKRYDAFTDQLDAFIHIDAENLHDVYDWRVEQENNLRATNGQGMTTEQVIKFVDGYFPSYELFAQTVRSGVFNPASRMLRPGGDHSPMTWKGRQLRLVINKQRRVTQVTKI